MSQEIERYLQAGTRASTRRSYQQALEHFEVTWVRISAHRDRSFR
ncbi:hypothetical protein [Pseudomonas aeruginosa]|nr:hypothetical protein [Pseudomonas aeruginosa]